MDKNLKKLFLDRKKALKAYSDKILFEGRFEDLGHTKIDLTRESRCGAGEVIYGAGKSPEQIIEIMKSAERRGENILATRLSESAMELVKKNFKKAKIYKEAGIAALTPKRIRKRGFIAIVCAGTSDLKVALETKVCSEFFGSNAKIFSDCGVAGIHRLGAVLPEIRKARVCVGIAGMEGALPSVLAGLVKVQVIALPTSVGYGASFGGLAALLAMLNSCSNGVSVVNIDNGFGAAYCAHLANAGFRRL